MSAPAFVTRFALLPRWGAALVLSLTIIGFAWCLTAALTAAPELAPVEDKEGKKERRSDWDFYGRVVDSVRAGENYYAALPPLFAEWKYQPFSLFNYRTPIYAWMLGALPNALWGQALLAILTLTTLLVAYTALRRETTPLAAIIGMLLLFGECGWCLIEPALYATELWAGLLLTLSLCLYALDRWPWAVSASLAALFLRELSLPYCVIALAFAAWRGRRIEAACWLIGFLGYALFMKWHLGEAAKLMPLPGERDAFDWVQFGGATFLLGTCRMNLFLILLPGWVAALYLPLALLGLASWRSEMGARAALTVGSYLAAFSIIGQDFNKYWGLMYTPLLALGLVWTPAALRDLWAALRRSQLGSLPVLAGPGQIVDGA